jgi:ankyrin repeat protein
MARSILLLVWLALAAPVCADDIHFLVMRGEREAILKQLEQGVSINEPDINTETPLHWAVRFRKPDMVEFLLSKGAAADVPDRYGHAPLYHVEDAKSAALLLERGANPGRRDQSGSTPLHEASLYGRTEIVRMMLDRKAEPNMVDQGLGKTPLHEACTFGSEGVVAMLLQAGARLDARTQDGETPLALAARSGSLPTVELLVNAGADASEAEPFLRAVQRGSVAVIDYLAARVRPTLDVMLAAAQWGELRVLRQLHARGGKLEPQLLPAAAAYGHTPILSWLLDQGLPVDGSDTYGVTGFMAAARSAQRPAMELLLQRGADPARRIPAGGGAADLVRTSIALAEAEILRGQRARKAFLERDEIEDRLERLRAILAWLETLGSP